VVLSRSLDLSKGKKIGSEGRCCDMRAIGDCRRLTSLSELLILIR
jgi:hypothetical protein